jgi:hypothetical protein
MTIGKSKLPGVRDYPKEVLLNGVVYKVRFVKKFDEDDTLGECCPSDEEIRIKLGQSRQDILKTFIHELLHMIEFEGPVELKHSIIYKLENHIYDLLIHNFFF